MDLDNTVFLSHTPDHFLWNHASVMLFLGTSAASIILVSGKKILFTKEIIKHFDKLLQYRQEHILLFGLNGDNNLRQIVN